MYNLYDLILGLKKESSFYADKNCEYPFSLDNKANPVNFPGSIHTYFIENQFLQ